MGEGVELGIALVKREDRGPGPPRVMDPLKQGDRRGRWRHDEQRLAALGGLQPLDTHPQVRWRARRDPPADERRPQLGNLRKAAFLVQVRGQVPRLLVGRADQEKPAWRPGRLAQPLREGAGPLKPSGWGEKRTECGHLVAFHPSIMPPGTPCGGGSGRIGFHE